MTENPYQAPAAKVGPQSVSARMPNAIRRDLLQQEASVRALGILSGVTAFVMLASMVQFLVANVINNVRYPIGGIHLFTKAIALTTSILIGFGVNRLNRQAWHGLIIVACFEILSAVFNFQPSVRYWNPVSGAITVGQVPSAGWLEEEWSFVLCLYTLLSAMLAKDATVTTLYYHKIIAQTPSIGPPPILKMLAKSVLICMAILLVWSWRRRFS